MSFFKIFVIISFVLSALNNTKGQDKPDYPERSLQGQTDPVQTSQLGTDNIETAQGSIDPDEYYVGPGDQIFVSISGLRETVYTLVINYEGWTYIPQVGAVDLNNNTLAEAKIELEESIRRYYKDVIIFISLVGFRNIRVSLTGDVIKPSNFIVSSNSRLMDLISISAGLNESADIRNIKIISRDNTEIRYNLLSFLRFGNSKNNPLLREGDIVLLDKADKTVYISGEIKFPGIYEFVENESVYQLIEMAGGFLSMAKRDTIEVVSFDETGTYQNSEFYSLKTLEHNEVILHNKDHVIVRVKPEYLIDHFVKVEGFVRYPGYYMIEKNKSTLSEVINKAGGLLENGSYTEATLTRKLSVSGYDAEFERLKTIPRVDMSDDEYAYIKAKSRERAGRVVVDFYDLLVNGNKNEDVTLYKGDIIYVPEKKNYITLLGQVVNPGSIDFNPELSISDYINLAGGFGWRALENDVIVIKALTGEWIEAGDVKSLEPGDTIWIPEDPPPPKFWDVFMDALAITAQLATVIVAVTAIIVASR
ncbi:MAG: SLBB domain-containing protein [Ignavibacterium sp.]|nr:MAG: SLBB domain-containing protein [Ignavibacterium sp.]